MKKCDIDHCSQPASMAFSSHTLYDMAFCTEHFLFVMVSKDLREAMVHWILEFEQKQLKGAS